MARVPNRFTDPKTGDYYDWHENHAEEEASGKKRNITHTAPTGLVGLVRQQAADDPYTLRWSGAILTRGQFKKMWHWYGLSRTQTIYLTDFDGEEYEVIITDFQPIRKRRLPNFATDPQQHYWTYTIEFEVLRFIDGDMKDEGVIP